MTHYTSGDGRLSEKPVFRTIHTDKVTLQALSFDPVRQNTSLLQRRNE